MDPTLRIDYDDVKRFIEWSFFIEEGAVDVEPELTTVEECEVVLSNKLLKLYRKMKKASKHNTELFDNLTYNEVEILRSWYYRVPEFIMGRADADTYTRLSMFMVGEER